MRTEDDQADAAVSGPVLFARYAFPPNQLGYCGPDDAAGFLARGVNGDDHGLREMARDFDGALPYLRLIADGNGWPDALDPRVVEAYWLGGPELDRVGPSGVDRRHAPSLPRTQRAALRHGSRTPWLRARGPITASWSSASIPGWPCSATPGVRRRP